MARYPQVGQRLTVSESPQSSGLLIQVQLPSQSPWSSETHEKMKLATIGYSAVLTVLLAANCRAAGDVIC
ncbi:hypothetical protein PGT21_015793 [Puccinia graminis f. sp. tritici]|uniref:Uncharacterized protein n=1 Tax=Puccinia graminis f. sp. tritici TaxID=56615 RepID=A0A5B0LVX2_PUCGR|nr:hypothetical protein PGT21_015793 [Puccinia graminis f. sp. tritici]KAA1093520.1 hypothetical protein PGTUg99_024807 [Puccinia graminis f. sp. tritici]